MTTERRARRPRPAAASRALAGGLSAGAMFALAGGLATSGRTVELPPAPEPVVTAAPAPRLVRVVVRVHHAPPRSAKPAYVVPPPRRVRRVVVPAPAPAPAPRPVTTSHGSR